MKDVFRHIIVTKRNDTLHLKIQKKHEPSLYAFILFSLAFISVVLFYLVPLAKENNQDTDSNVLQNIELLFYFVGTIIAVAGVVEIFRQEWIEINKMELILGKQLLGRSYSEKRYVLKHITELELAPTPTRGWRVIDEYEDVSQKQKTYSKDIRKVFPTISFHYENKQVLFASGIENEESKEIIALINTYRL